MIFNLNTGSNVKLFTFPDGQPHANINTDFAPGDDCEIICSLTNANKLLQMMQVAEAINNLRGSKCKLFIPYLMGARSDRVMVKGDSCDLKIIARMINSTNFKQVVLCDVHSDVTLQLIENSISINNRNLVWEYKQKDAVLICPDAGAVKKIDKYLEWNKNIKDVVYCIKSRDFSNGKITLKVLEPEKCEGKNCVIIDDLIDGGRTFTLIAQQIKSKHLTLIVTHGIFSQGFSELEKYFQEIITTDSFPFNGNSTIVKQINIV